MLCVTFDVVNVHFHLHLLQSISFTVFQVLFEHGVYYSWGFFMPNQTALEEIRVLIESHKVSYAFLNCGNHRHIITIIIICLWWKPKPCSISLLFASTYSYTIFSHTNAYFDIEASLGNMPLKAPIELLVVNGNLYTNYQPPISFSSQRTL